MKSVSPLQALLPPHPPSVSQLPGSDPHGLGHLPPAEGADGVHVRKYTPVLTGHVYNTQGGGGETRRDSSLFQPPHNTAVCVNTCTLVHVGVSQEPEPVCHTCNIRYPNQYFMTHFPHARRWCGPCS